MNNPSKLGKLVLSTFLVLGLSSVVPVFAEDKSSMTDVAAESVATVNINKASAEELANTLTGVGVKKAELIVQYREAHGDFKSVEELTNVKGIGPAILEKNSARIRL